MPFPPSMAQQFSHQRLRWSLHFYFFHLPSWFGSDFEKRENKWWPWAAIFTPEIYPILCLLNSYTSWWLRWWRICLGCRRLELKSLGQGDPLGEGNGCRLQSSCLENLRDGGAWRAAVHGVTESDTAEQLTLLLSCITFQKQTELILSNSILKMFRIGGPSWAGSWPES